VPDISESIDILHDCRDVSRLNAVVNDPSVRPFIGAPEAGVLDMAPLLDDPKNLFPFGEHGGFALVWTAPHAFEVHTFILPSGRGFWARLAAYAGIEMAKAKGARLLWTQVPVSGFPHIKAYAHRMGMTETGETNSVFGHKYSVLSMDIHPCQ
jgi:hypothetical protein